MANRNWHSRVLDALRQQGLPNDYLERLAAELADHATDISQEEPSMKAHIDVEDRLGSPQELALTAKREFQRRTFAGRHPIITFLAGPIVAMVAALVLSVVLVIALTWLLDLVLGGVLGANDLANLPPTPLETSVMQGASLIVRFLPFIATALFFYYLGRRTARPIWGTVACGVVAIAAICFQSTIHPPGVYDVQGTWVMGLAIHRFGLEQILQAVAPIAVGAWLLWPQLRQIPMVVAE